MPTNLLLRLARVVDGRLRGARLKSPGLRRLTRLFEVVYFTSLKTEEARPLQIRLLLVDPNNPDPGKPPRPRPHRWKISKLGARIPLTVPNLIKLSKAADPWSSSLAVYFDKGGEYFVWGLVDQAVQFSTMVVRERESGYTPPGLFQVVATGTADLTVYRDLGFLGRLAQDTLITSQTNVFWSGPISDRLDQGIGPYLDAVQKRLGKNNPPEADEWASDLADNWIDTLCRLLISIQRYRHGGALLLTSGTSDLTVKYELRYERFPNALVNLGVEEVIARRAGDLIQDRLTGHESVSSDLYYVERFARHAAEDYKEEITGCVRFVSSLSCVDGLILATPNLAVRGFGVEIRTKKEIRSVYLCSGPNPTSRNLRRIDASHYGTRHRSMMRYCYAHPNSVGFVISQDGDIRAITRIGRRLVMWDNLKIFNISTEEYKVPTRVKRSRK